MFKVPIPYGANFSKLLNGKFGGRGGGGGGGGGGAKSLSKLRSFYQLILQNLQHVGRKKK